MFFSLFVLFLCSQKPLFYVGIQSFSKEVVFDSFLPPQPFPSQFQGSNCSVTSHASWLEPLYASPQSQMPPHTLQCKVLYDFIYGNGTGVAQCWQHRVISAICKLSTKSATWKENHNGVYAGMNMIPNLKLAKNMIQLHRNRSGAVGVSQGVLCRLFLRDECFM